ncbi:HNH endonuclease [Hydrogenophaga pseudoflava]|uniref:HNH endonuclease n=1 Tax=Hydrogenophaga pseudoflava TaxID=47421 RepID=UPI0027E52628|nr:HNH endonuclease [Hydrogenophaga pseudoflava]MDQ7745426.1 HNH endonuclease [Hydrogenophaga pseudoflava]
MPVTTRAGRVYATGTLAERIAAHIAVQENGCWNWTGCLNSNGYGQIRVSGRSVLAHRASFETAVRKLSRDEQVLHRCDNPLCCNPDHLFTGDPAANSDDKVSKRRQAKGFRLPHTKLTPEQVIEIRESNETQSVIAQRYGIAQSNVSRIRSGLRRTDLDEPEYMREAA